MKGYGQFCPVAVASEVFAQRWTPLIIRELCSGRSHFNEIHRGIPLISRTLLAERLRWLESAGVVASSAARAGRVREYRLTESGAEFKAVDRCAGQLGPALVSACRLAQPRCRLSDVAPASSARSRSIAGPPRGGSLLVQRRTAQAPRTAQLLAHARAPRSRALPHGSRVTKWIFASRPTCALSRRSG